MEYMDSKSMERQFWKQVRVPVLIVLLMYLAFGLEFLLPGDLHYLGVYPRKLEGMVGILTAPFVHGDWSHIHSNAFSFLFLSGMVFVLYPRIAPRVYILIHLLTGLFVWLMARSVFHIGASGVVYGLVSFIFWMGIFRKNLRSVIPALIVLMLYGSFFEGVLPNQEGISWESHLLGGVAGLIVAYLLRNQWERVEILEKEQQEALTLRNNSERETFFLPRDVFELGKDEYPNDQQ